MQKYALLLASLLLALLIMKPQMLVFFPGTYSSSWWGEHSAFCQKLIFH